MSVLDYVLKIGSMCCQINENAFHCNGLSVIIEMLLIFMFIFGPNVNFWFSSDVLRTVFQYLNQNIHAKKVFSYGLKCSSSNCMFAESQTSNGFKSTLQICSESKT